MATVQDLPEINAAVDTIITDGGILHDVIHGPAPVDPTVPVTVNLGEGRDIINLASALARIQAGGISEAEANALIADALHILSINSFTLDDTTGMLSIAYTNEIGATSITVDLSNLITNSINSSSAIVMEDLTNTNLDSIITPGWYRMISGIINIPPNGQQGAMRVLSTGDAGNFRQDYYERDITPPHHYTRSTLDSGLSWTNWLQALHTPDLGSPDQVLTSTGTGYDWGDLPSGLIYNAGAGINISGNEIAQTHDIVYESVSSGDLNIVIQGGWYRVVGGGTIQNRPTVDEGVMLVTAYNNDLIAQVFYDITSPSSPPHQYIRSSINGGSTWIDWNQTLHTQDLGSNNQVLTSTGSGYGWANLPSIAQTHDIDFQDLPPYADLNDYTLSGWYRVNEFNIANTPNINPFGILLVLTITTPFPVQVFYDFITAAEPHQWIRSAANGVWGAWEEYLHVSAGNRTAGQLLTATGTSSYEWQDPPGSADVLPSGASTGDYLRFDENGNSVWDDNPLPIDRGNNRMTSIDGQRIRSFGTDYIEFAVYALANSDVVVTSDVEYNWDDISSVNQKTFTVTVQNDQVITEEWVERITQKILDGTPQAGVNNSQPVIVSPNGAQFQQTFTFNDPVRDPITNFNNGACGDRDISAQVRTNAALTGTPYMATASGDRRASVSWLSPSAVFSVTSSSTIYFDSRRNIINTRLRVSNTSDASSNISFTAPVMTAPSSGLSITSNPGFSGRDAVITFSYNDYIYHDASSNAVVGSVEVLYSRPSAMYQDNTARSYTENKNLNQNISSRLRSYIYSTTSNATSLTESAIVSSSSGLSLSYSSNVTRSNDTTLTADQDTFSIVNPSIVNPLFLWLIFPTASVSGINENDAFAPSPTGATRITGVLRQTGLQLGFTGHKVSFDAFRITISASDGVTPAMVYIR